jgi:hypothetical protein
MMQTGAGDEGSSTMSMTISWKKPNFVLQIRGCPN